MPCQSFLQHKSSVSKTLPEGAAGTDAHILYFPVTEAQVQDKTEKIHVLTAFFFLFSYSVQKIQKLFSSAFQTATHLHCNSHQTNSKQFIHYLIPGGQRGIQNTGQQSA